MEDSIHNNSRLSIEEEIVQSIEEGKNAVVYNTDQLLPYTKDDDILDPISHCINDIAKIQAFSVQISGSCTLKQRLDCSE